MPNTKAQSYVQEMIISWLVSTFYWLNYETNTHTWIQY